MYNKESTCEINGLGLSFNFIEFRVWFLELLRSVSVCVFLQRLAIWAMMSFGAIAFLKRLFNWINLSITVKKLSQILEAQSNEHLLLRVSMDQEPGSGLAGWFWLQVSYKLALKLSGVWLGWEAVPGWLLAGTSSPPGPLHRWSDCLPDGAAGLPHSKWPTREHKLAFKTEARVFSKSNIESDVSWFLLYLTGHKNTNPAQSGEGLHTGVTSRSEDRGGLFCRLPTTSF